MAKLRIGRSDINDIVLEDTSISRKHAEIEELGDGIWRLTDIGSSAGTFVKEGGQWTQISSADIESDTEVRFGEAEFHLADIVSVDPSTIRPNTASGLGQRAEKGADEISREMRQVGGASGSIGRTGAVAAASGGGAGLTRNTKLLIFGGGGVLLLIVVAVLAVALAGGGVAIMGGGGVAIMGGGAKAELARMLTARCKARGKQSADKCECLGKSMAGGLTEDEARRTVAAGRENKQPPPEIIVKFIGGAMSAAKKCGATG